jgi:hypothetical protein
MKQERKQNHLRVTLRIYIGIYLNHLGRQKNLLQAITNPLFFVRHVTHIAWGVSFYRYKYPAFPPLPLFYTARQSATQQAWTK